MKKIILCLVLLLSGFKSYANDGLYNLASNMLSFYKSELNANGYSDDVDLRFDEGSNSTEAFVNPISGYEYNGLIDSYILYIGGGLFGPQISKLETLTIFAHEMGHLIGKRVHAHDETSYEGEADYQVGPTLIKYLSSFEHQLFDEYQNSSLESTIATTYQLNPSDKNDYAKIKVAAASYQMLKRVLEEDIAVEMTANPVAVSETTEFYPAAQIRWDTIISGILGKPRPISWAVPSDFE